MLCNYFVREGMSLDVVATLTCTSCAAWCPDLKHGKGQLTQFDSCTAMKRPEGQVRSQNTQKLLQAVGVGESISASRSRARSHGHR